MTIETNNFNTFDNILSYSLNQDSVSINLINVLEQNSTEYDTLINNNDDIVMQNSF